MKHGNFFVWMQTTTQRDSSLTRRSIEASDIGNQYTVVVDETIRHFPEDYRALQLWWEEQMLAMANEALRQNCLWVLRLEDDILVNQHILHNLRTWSALQDPLFGVGLLFHPNYWKNTPWAFKQSEQSKAIYKDSEDVEGAQGQLLRADHVEKLIPLTRRARADRGLNKPTDSVSFDWSISRAACMLGRETHPGKPLRAFIHDPALVDLNEQSCKSVIGAVELDPESHYWGDEAFSLTWRRRVFPRP